MFIFLNSTLSSKITPTAGVGRTLFAFSLFFTGWIQSVNAQEAFTAEPASVTSECTVYNINPQDFEDKNESRDDSSPFEALQGKTIGHIRIEQINVFNENDPDENNRIYRLLNKLHITTREKVVRSQLLFKVGDKVNYKSLQETARNLRTRKYLTNAHVLPERVCGDQVDVLVITQDAWVLEPQVSFSHKSSDNESGFAISDGNVLGTGNSFKIGYEENQLRKTISYDFSNPYFLNKQIAVRALYQDTSDGRNTLFTVARPFYALDTPMAMGLQYSDLSQADEIRSHDKVVNSFRHRAIDNELYFGIATDINSNFTQRWVVGITHEEDSFFPNEDTMQPIPERDKAVYTWIEYQYLQNQ